MPLTPINPSTGEILAEYPTLTPKETRAAVRAAHRAWAGWHRTSFEQRAGMLRRAAALLEESAGEYAGLMAREMGKPVAAGESEIGKCAWACRYFADQGERFLADEPVETDGSRSFVSFRPLGVVLAIMPWNFPFWQVFRFAAPTLMAGNAALLKHASNVPGCALAIEELFRRAGFPDGLFRTLLIDTRATAAVIRNPLVRAVSLTGSVEAGRAVARAAGAKLKKTVLELGGSDPYLVLEDADLDLAVETCVASRLINAGQSCIAAKRFIVVEPVREEFERRFVGRMRQAVVGDPLDRNTQVGPLARYDLREQLHDQVRRSIERGARCLLGGEIPEGPGAFYPPTILADVSRGMPAYQEELFGPVAAIIAARNEKVAIRIANDSAFGLGAAVFTRDVERGTRIADREIEAGSCFVNALVKSDPRLPFGGVKDSGYGRELSHYGLKEFVNIKTVWAR